jgi:hypothetical protein
MFKRVVDVMRQDKISVYTKSEEVNVVEKVESLTDYVPKQVQVKTSIAGGGSGMLFITGTVEKPLVISGTNVYARLHIRNETIKTIGNIKAELKKKTNIAYFSDDAQDKHRRKTVEIFSPKQTFKGSFDPGEQRSMLICMPVPVSRLVFLHFQKHSTNARYTV